MMIKTLLFGAGASAKAFMSNCAEEREFVGIVDNDKNKDGQVLDGVVICGPEKLTEFTYDEIVITTQWASEVKTQLIDSLGIAPEKICIPPKSKLKKQTPPFYNEVTRAFGRKIICELSAIAIERNVPLVLDFGTLLGVIRECDIIAWDDDIDMSVPEGFFDLTIDVIERFISQDNSGVSWQVEKTLDKSGRGMGIVLLFVDPENSLSDFKTTFSIREFKEGKSIHLPSLGMWFSPEEHFRHAETINWYGNSIQIPAKAKDYLAFLYGDDWHTPKKNITFSDYANTQAVEFSEFLDAGLHVDKDTQ